ncbi:type II toxin-antitoxin system RelE family toxin [Streptomyces cavernae]|uniref:type II toxin-antitoxin system RelE family toxin n=1 Tax=Streptomyces cavernae TaxID=2259034 RepID=UPI000FEB96CF|nr:type II toxin-antitoxin system RelE/ParE family toxin [Streptomyces cavernae]
MTYQIIWHEQATSNAVRFLKDDPDGLRQVFAAVDLLADDPRPEGTIALGSPDLRRLHVGLYRLMYEINDGAITIFVLHIGRVP